MREAQRLEERLADWSPTIERKRDDRHALALTAWDELCEADRREFARASQAWHAAEDERRLDLERRLLDWEAERERERVVLAGRTRAALSLRSALVSLVAGGAALIATQEPTLALLAFVIAMLACGWAVLAGLIGLLSLPNKRPVADLEQNPVPVLAPPPPRPGPPPPAPVDLEVVEPWWRAVAHRYRQPSGTPWEIAGQDGENSFADLLSRQLGDEYVGIRNVRMKPTLDADLILVGPTGIWVFEVKTWSGILECHGGRWSRIKHDGEREYPTRDWSEQWKDVRDVIEQTLDGRLGGNPGHGRLIRGGLVFAHPRATLGTVETNREAYGGPVWWANRVAATSPQHEERIDRPRVIEALLKRDHGLPGGSERVVHCAKQAAQQIYAQATEQAQIYCLGRAG